MITGEQIRAARQRAGLTQEEVGQMLNVTLRTVGNWERGESVPRNREAMIRALLVDHLDEPADPPLLRDVADVELLAEIARRFARSRREDGGEHARSAASNQAAVSAATEPGPGTPDVAAPESERTSEEHVELDAPPGIEPTPARIARGRRGTGTRRTKGTTERKGTQPGMT